MLNYFFLLFLVIGKTNKPFGMVWIFELVKIRQLIVYLKARFPFGKTSNTECFGALQN